MRQRPDRERTLEACQGGAEAEVDPVAERDVPVVRAVEQQPVWLRESLGITIRCPEQDPHPFSSAQDPASDLHVRLDDADPDLDGAIEAQQLLDGGPEEIRVTMQRAQRVGMPQQREHAVADQVGGRLVPGEQQERAGLDQLVLLEPRAVGLCAHEAAHQIVVASLATMTHDVAEVIVEGGGTLLCASDPICPVGGHLHRAAERGEVYGPLLDPVEVGGRHAEQVADHHRRKGKGEVRHEIARAGLGQAVEQEVDYRLHPRPQALHDGGGERRCDEIPEPRVAGRVVENEPARRVEDAASAVNCAREDAVLAEREQRISVARQRPHPLRLVPTDRRLGAQPMQQRVRIGENRRIEESELEAHGCGAFEDLRTTATGPIGSPTRLGVWESVRCRPS